jgi:hypothetical protein
MRPDTEHTIGIEPHLGESRTVVRVRRDKRPAAETDAAVTAVVLPKNRFLRMPGQNQITPARWRTSWAQRTENASISFSSIRFEPAVQ